jgi:hypothetical protein
MSKIKVLFYGDAPTASTGFGVVAKNILTNLHKTGKYDITILGVNYFPEPNPYQKTFDMWPLGFFGKGDPFGRQFSSGFLYHELYGQRSPTAAELWQAVLYCYVLPS